MKDYRWYQDKFCCDLGLCEFAEQDWGTANFDPDRVNEIAQYYLDHPEYGRVGREMLIESVLESFFARLLKDSADVSTHDLVRRAVARAMADTYDRDVLRAYWYTEDRPNDPNPLYRWLRESFPGWSPPPSVWSEESNE